jgi:hypothetical protein
MPRIIQHVKLAKTTNQQSRPMKWFISWLVGTGASEGEQVYSGEACTLTDISVPAEAVGLRIRKWPSEGLHPEYVDVLLASISDELDSEALDFDMPQVNSMLTRRLEPGR